MNAKTLQLIFVLASSWFNKCMLDQYYWPLYKDIDWQFTPQGGN